MSRLRLMVVEDEFIVALELREVLEGMGHRVCRMVSSGEEAVDAAAIDRPDCVLMDVNIRGALGGVEAAATIQARFATPVILLTGLPGWALEQQVRGTRLSPVLAKPIDHEQLRACSTASVRRTRARDRLRLVRARPRKLGRTMTSEDPTMTGELNPPTGPAAEPSAGGSQPGLAAEEVSLAWCCRGSSRASPKG